MDLRVAVGEGANEVPLLTVNLDTFLARIARDAAQIRSVWLAGRGAAGVIGIYSGHAAADAACTTEADWITELMLDERLPEGDAAFPRGIHYPRR